MHAELNRRQFLAVSLAALPTQVVQEGIVGEPHGVKAGKQMFADGGNVVDAIVSAAAASAVATPHMCGFGGYGGHLILAVDGGKKITCLDFNSAAPKAAHPAMFLQNNEAQLARHMYGWLAVGVPGIPAGLDRAVNKFGTFTFKKVLQPAITLCEEGFSLGPGVAAAIKTAQGRMAKDPGSASLYYPQGNALAPNSLFKNPALGKLLALMAKENSSHPFYQGGPARLLARAMKENGGILTEDDLKNYQALEVAPLRMNFRGKEFYTAPVTAGGISALQVLGILKGIEWGKVAWGAHLFARVEAMRLAWRDRLEHLGDTGLEKGPAERLLSPEYLGQCREKVLQAVKLGECLPAARSAPSQTGTINLSAADRHGNLAALTLTHGGAFGAQVTVPELGLTLGHGMSRFEIRPGHANSPGPRKRPLNNMCPTVVVQEGKAVAALGGRGGRRIPNSLFEVLFQIGQGESLAKAVAAGRVHTEGGLEVDLEKSYGETALKNLQVTGLQAKFGAAATISAVHRNPESGEVITAMR